jgi:hypothetical protein
VRRHDEVCKPCIGRAQRALDSPLALLLKPVFTANVEKAEEFEAQLKDCSLQLSRARVRVALLANQLSDPSRTIATSS